MLPPELMSNSPNIYIAIVDDDASLCSSLSRFLRAAHFQTVAYSSAEALLEDTKHPKFECLVLDIQLKGISGLELAQRLHAVKDGTPVVFITAYDDPDVRTQAEACGCAGYFRKTDSGAAVLDGIRRAIGMESSGSPDNARQHPSADASQWSAPERSSG